MNTVRVIPFLRLPRFVEGFSYLVPAGLVGRVLPGSIVRVPFRSREILAVVWKEESEAASKATLELLAVEPGHVPEGVRAFADALAREHLTVPGAFPHVVETGQKAAPRPAATTFSAWLGEPSRDADRFSELAGSGPALVVASGAGASSIPDSGAGWKRGSDNDLLDCRPPFSAVIVAREESPEHRRRVPPYLNMRRAAIVRAQTLGTSAILAARCRSTETEAGLEASTVRSLGPMPVLPDQVVRTAASWSDPHVLEAIHSTVHEGGSAFIWVPAVGYAGGLVCRSCGLVIRCPRCGVPEPLSRSGILHCVSCGHESSVPAQCPRCGSSQLAPSALGSAGLRAALRRSHPDLPVALLTAKHPVPAPAFRGVLIGSHAYLDRLAEWGVRLAVVSSVERFLGIPNFRAEERFAQHLAALRWALPARGQLILASRDEERVNGWLKDPREKVAALLPERREFLYPPYVRLAMLSGRSAAAAVGSLEGVLRWDALPGPGGRILLRIDPRAWDTVALRLIALPRTITVEPDPEDFGR